MGFFIWNLPQIKKTYIWEKKEVICNLCGEKLPRKIVKIECSHARNLLPGGRD